MTRTRRFLGGIGTGYAYQLAAIVVGLWLTPFLLSRLGARDFGLWLTATQLIAYLGLLDIGVLAILPRETAYATGRAGGSTESAEVPHVLGRTARIVLWQMPVIVLGTALAWWFLPADWRELRGPMLLMLSVFVLTYPLRLSHAALQGFQDLAFAGMLQMCAWGSGTVLTIVLVLRGWGLAALAVGASLTQIMLYGGCTVRVLHRFASAIPHRLPAVPWRESFSYVHRGFWVSVGQFAHVLLYSTDILIVAWYFGPVTVVPYSCTQKLIAVLTNQPQVLAQVAAPALSELRMKATREKLFAVTSSLSLALMIASGAVLIVVLAVNRTFVSWWVGSSLYGGAVLTGLFAGAMLVRHFNTALVYSLFSFGHERRMSLTAMADGGVTLVLSMILAQSFGVSGIPLAFLSGALLVSVPANLIALSRETGVSPMQFVATLNPWALRIFALLPVAVAVNVFVRSSTAISVAAVLLVMSGAYALLMWPVATRPPLGEYIRSGLQPVLGRFGLRRAVPPPALTTVVDQSSRTL
jgi:O-antigen/teichoic acid export membrane protein